MNVKVQASALALGVALYASAAAAQETGTAPPPAASDTAPASAEGKAVYTPADFARFAPTTAYDMLVQVPSFVIRRPDTDRGLGQASENVLINGQRIANKTGLKREQILLNSSHLTFTASAPASRTLTSSSSAAAGTW